MIRKVLTIGQSSFAVTLPRDFIREHKLKPGQDLQVAHEGSMLTVKTLGTGVHVKTDLSSVTEHYLQEPDEFINELLHGYFLAGANKVTITNAKPHVKQAIKRTLATTTMQFYESSDEGPELHILCPVKLTEHAALESLARRSLQLLYACFEEPAGSPCAVREHIDLARRAISQNLHRREHLALYAFLESIDVLAATLEALPKRPTYLKRYAHATYLLHQALTATTLKPICNLLTHLKELRDDAQALGPEQQPHAAQLLACLRRAAANLVMYHAPA